jgi:hypothetical protein
MRLQSINTRAFFNPLLFAISAIFLTVLFSSCNHQLKKDKLYRYVESQDNGTSVSKTVSGIDFRFTYTPGDLVAMRFFPEEVPFDKGLYEKKVKELSGLLYFTLSVSSGEKDLLFRYAGDPGKYGQLVSVLSFGLEKHTFIVTSAYDTLLTLGSTFSRTFGVTPYNSIQFIFPKPKDDPSWVDIIIEDFGVDTGDLRFRFNLNDLKRVPKLAV